MDEGGERARPGPVANAPGPTSPPDHASGAEHEGPDAPVRDAADPSDRSDRAGAVPSTPAPDDTSDEPGGTVRIAKDAVSGTGANGTGGKGPGSKGPGSKGPGSKGPGSKGPGSKGPGSNGAGGNGAGSRSPGSGAGGPGAGAARSRLDGPTTHIADARGGARPSGANGSARAPQPGPRGPSGPPRPGGPRPGLRTPPPGQRTPASGPLPSQGRGPSGPPSGPLPAGGSGAPLPGSMIIERYRLVDEVGRDRAAGAVLWKARDVMLERDVAVTLLVGGWQADARASSALSRATRSAHFEHPAAARVLDVVQPGAGRLPAGVLGAAVAEWTPGRDLVELVANGPLRPSAALRVVEPLAAAVAEAHRSGLVLGLEHPQRVRVGARASARLAFPMPRGDAGVDDDVHGLGASLYLLLTARWPATDGQAPAGLRSAPRLASGAPVPARQLRPDLPVELAALVDRTLDADGGIRTAAAVHRLVTQMRERLDDDGVLLPVTEDGVQLGEDPSAVWQDDDEPESDTDPATRRKLRIGVTLLVVATLAIVSFVAFQLVSLLGAGGSSAPPLVIPTSAPAPAPSSPAPVAAPAPAPPAPAPAGPPGAPVQLSSVAVYDPSGDPDNPTRVNRAVDGDPSSTWDTSSYRQQLPSLKPGIGVMTTFSQPAAVAAVTVRSYSPGSRIEIRSAPAADVPLTQTQLLGAGVVTDADQVVIPLQAAPPTGNLLVWITTLGQEDDEYVTKLAEVTVQRAG